MALTDNLVQSFGTHSRRKWFHLISASLFRASE
jgi:hypothetical protein